MIRRAVAVVMVVMAGLLMMGMAAYADGVAGADAGIAPLEKPAVMADYPGIDDPIIRAEIMRLLLADIDPAAEMYQQLLDNLVKDGMEIKQMMDARRVEIDDARLAASRAKRAHAMDSLWWLGADRPAPTHLTSPSPLWLVIPGGLLIGAGGYLRRRYTTRHSNTTPPSMARKGR